MGGVVVRLPSLPVAVAAAGGFGMFSAVLQPAEVLAGALDAPPRHAPRSASTSSCRPRGSRGRSRWPAARVAARRLPSGASLIRRWFRWVHDGGALVSWQVRIGGGGRAAGPPTPAATSSSPQGVRGRRARPAAGSGCWRCWTSCSRAVDEVPGDRPRGGLATESARWPRCSLRARRRARVGTRFVATHEGARRGARHPDYVDALLRFARRRNTVWLTEALLGDVAVGAATACLRLLHRGGEGAGDSAIVGETSMGGATFGVPALGRRLAQRVHGPGRSPRWRSTRVRASVRSIGSVRVADVGARVGWTKKYRSR